MAPLKSPRLDGFNASFFKHYWDFVGPEVIVAALKFPNEGQINRDINHTFLSSYLSLKTLNVLVIIDPLAYTMWSIN